MIVESNPAPGEKVGLFFGSFNPIHTGHLIVAQYMISFTRLDRICFVVSPQNPFKEVSELVDAKHRYRMVELAISDNDRFFSTDVEFTLPVPSYTIDTLDLLSTRFPDTDFSLILGSDNLMDFEKWKEADRIARTYQIYVYIRPEYSIDVSKLHPHMHLYDAPSLYISSSHIRSCLTEGRSIRYLVPDVIVEYIRKEKLW